MNYDKPLHDMADGDDDFERWLRQSAADQNAELALEDEAFVARVGAALPDRTRRVVWPVLVCGVLGLLLCLDLSGPALAALWDGLLQLGGAMPMLTATLLPLGLSLAAVLTHSERS